MRLIIGEFLCRSKVAQLDAPGLGVHEHVGRFKIPMGYVSHVEVLDSAQELMDNDLIQR